MKFRKLRTAWSVFWGSVCALSIAMWVLSARSPFLYKTVQPLPDGSIRMTEVTITTTSVFPIWLPTLSTVLIAALPWLPWRFSLRTLLIAMTLVAVALGLIVWSVSQ
jgi:hypothetical protein